MLKIQAKISDRQPPDTIRKCEYDPVALGHSEEFNTAAYFTLKATLSSCQQNASKPWKIVEKSTIVLTRKCLIPR